MEQLFESDDDEGGPPSAPAESEPAGIERVLAALNSTTDPSFQVSLDILSPQRMVALSGLYFEVILIWLSLVRFELNFVPQPVSVSFVLVVGDALRRRRHAKRSTTSRPMRISSIIGWPRGCRCRENCRVNFETEPPPPCAPRRSSEHAIRRDPSWSRLPACPVCLQVLTAVLEASAEEESAQVAEAAGIVFLKLVRSEQVF
eukprot:SAG11_NODE_636_length_8034_cov_5.199118_12_plen_202_part_00